MNKEEFDVLVNDILKVPMEEPPVSAYGSININELRQVIQAFNKIPNYDELIKDNCKKDKEIERLNNEVKTLLKENSNKEKVIIKQNNIIDELERILFSNKMYGERVFEKSGLSAEEFKEQHPYTLGSYDNSVNLLDKLKALKEGKE